MGNTESYSRRISQAALYPYLLSFYFVIFVFSENLGEVYLQEIVRPLAILVTASFVLIFLISIVLRSTHIAAFVIAGCLGIVFFHRGLYELVPVSWVSQPMFLAGELVFLLFSVIVLGVLIPDWRAFNRTLNTVAAILVAVALVPVGRYALAENSRLVESAINVSPVRADQTAGGTDRPDIYYILTDAYARSDVLKDYFGYDNSAFEEYLERKGFKVARQSSSNYPYTTLVVNSVFNLGYVADENGFIEGPGGAKLTLPTMIRAHRVGRFLQKRGYARLASMWLPMAPKIWCTAATGFPEMSSSARFSKRQFFRFFSEKYQIRFFRIVSASILQSVKSSGRLPNLVPNLSLRILWCRIRHLSITGMARTVAMQLWVLANWSICQKRCGDIAIRFII